MKRIGINGLGRIGRRLTHLIETSDDVEIVAINDIMPIEMAVYFLKYDSTYGQTAHEITAQDNFIVYNNHKIHYSSFDAISELQWSEFKIDITVNCSGTNKSKPQLTQYLEMGIPKVVLSSPPDSEDIPIVILGYNEVLIDSSPIISNASCTTYCVAPILDIFNRHFGIEFANFTTVHCYTSDQNLQDAYHHDYRRSRAAGVNIIPTTTSATKVIKRIFPDLKNRVMGSSFRVPVINGSVTEFIMELKSDIALDTILKALELESQTVYKDVISMTRDKLVSTDVINSHYAALIDLNSIEVSKNIVKMMSFYDNETGYSYQLMRLIGKL
jgi:glyceraldehyde 3-phosphate dehydrogenase